MSKETGSHVKLEMLITLSNRFTYVEYGSVERFILKIRVLQKDRRFETDRKINKTLMYTSISEKFDIKTDYLYPAGKLLGGEFVLPSKGCMGMEMILTFNADKYRYQYLKGLKNSINNWANYWWGFAYDGASELVMMDNKWTVYCDEPKFHALNNILI